MDIQSPFWNQKSIHWKNDALRKNHANKRKKKGVKNHSRLFLCNPL